MMPRILLLVIINMWWWHSVQGSLLYVEPPLGERGWFEIMLALAETPCDMVIFQNWDDPSAHLIFVDDKSVYAYCPPYSATLLEFELFEPSAQTDLDDELSRIKGRLHHRPHLQHYTVLQLHMEDAFSSLHAKIWSLMRWDRMYGMERHIDWTGVVGSNATL